MRQHVGALRGSARGPWGRRARARVEGDHADRTVEGEEHRRFDFSGFVPAGVAQVMSPAGARARREMFIFSASFVPRPARGNGGGAEAAALVPVPS